MNFNFLFSKRISLFSFSHRLFERTLSCSPILAPLGLLSFMRIYFLPGHKEMEGLRTLRNLSETTAPRRSAPTRRLREQRVEGEKVWKKRPKKNEGAFPLTLYLSLSWTGRSYCFSNPSVYQLCFSFIKHLYLLPPAAFFHHSSFIHLNELVFLLCVSSATRSNITFTVPHLIILH